MTPNVVCHSSGGRKTGVVRPGAGVGAIFELRRAGCTSGARRPEPTKRKTEINNHKENWGINSNSEKLESGK